MLLLKLFFPFWMLVLVAGSVQGQSDSLNVKEFVLCKDVIEREPIEIVSDFSINDERAWVFARINNDNGLQNVTFRWIHNDEIHSEVVTKIGNSNNWRTYSNVTLQAGSWKAQLYNRSDSLLTEIQFNVSE